jgi:hypothetical protein
VTTVCRHHRGQGHEHEHERRVRAFPLPNAPERQPVVVACGTRRVLVCRLVLSMPACWGPGGSDVLIAQKLGWHEEEVRTMESGSDMGIVNRARWLSTPKAR